MNLFQFILDTIAPPDPAIRAIEVMDPAEFAGRAGTLAEKDRVEGIVSFFPYKSEIVRTVLIEIKSRRNKRIVSLLGSVMHERLAPVANDYPLLVPIPMTKKRLRERGWNQCELLVKAISEKDGGRVFEMRTDILAKVRENEDQVGKGRQERFENLKGCFEVRDAKEVAGRDVLVLDDIVTTGATLKEAYRALRESGAKSIMLVSIAH